MSSNGNGRYPDYEAPFTLLTAGKPRWRSFTAGFGVEFLVLACALWVPLLFPKQMDIAKQYMITEITAPPIRAWKPQPKVRPKLQPVKRVEVAKLEPVPVPEPPKPKMIEPVFNKPIVSKPVIRRNLTKAPEVNVFARAVPDKPTTSLGSSAIPDLKRPKAPVQTGGFGDPDGLPSKAKMTQPVNIAPAGGFDMPVGPGKGNGTGGAKGVQGVVASDRGRSSKRRDGATGSVCRRSSDKWAARAENFQCDAAPGRAGNFVQAETGIYSRRKAIEDSGGRVVASCFQGFGGSASSARIARPGPRTGSERGGCRAEDPV